MHVHACAALTGISINQLQIHLQAWFFEKIATSLKNSYLSTSMKFYNKSIAAMGLSAESQQVIKSELMCHYPNDPRSHCNNLVDLLNLWDV